MIMSLKIIHTRNNCIRLEIFEDSNLLDVYKIQKKKSTLRIFIVFELDGLDTRFPMPNFIDEKSFIENLNIFNSIESGMDSGSIDYSSAKFIDVYVKTDTKDFLDTLNND